MLATALATRAYVIARAVVSACGVDVGVGVGIGFHFGVGFGVGSNDTTAMNGDANGNKVNQGIC